MRSILLRRRATYLGVGSIAAVGLLCAVVGLSHPHAMETVGRLRGAVGGASRSPMQLRPTGSTQPVAPPGRSSGDSANSATARAEADATTGLLCRQLARQQADTAGDAGTDHDEPGEPRRRWIATCANQPIASDDDVDTLLRTAADAGSPRARRELLEARLRQDEQDTDAVTPGLPDPDRASVRAYYADDVQAIRELALKGDTEAANVMAQLADDGRLVDGDPIAAAAWRLFASALAAPSLPGDATLSTDPALDDFGDRERAMAVAQAKDLYAQRH